MKIVYSNSRKRHLYEGYDKLNPNALRSHEAHMISRNVAADQGNYKSWLYHNTAAQLVIRKGRPLTQNERTAIWNNKSKKFPKQNKFSDIETKYPSLRRLAGKPYPLGMSIEKEK